MRDQDQDLDGLADEFLDRRLRGEALDLDAFLAGRPGGPELTVAQRAQLEKLARVLGDGEAAGALPAAAAEAPPRERLGDFRLLQKLGEGGMGVVWLAEQVSLKRHVALKLLRNESIASSRAAERFEREARTVAQLRHPGIVPVLAAGSEGGLRYLAMEYVEGRGLDEIVADAVARGDQDPKGAACVRPLDAVRWCRDVARALACAHSAGVVHRDVKPSNIRVTTDGRALLLDFGLARAESDPRLSQSGHFLGSPSYASPEQIEPRGEVDAHTDVYSLGVVLYECVVGQVPFDGKTTQQVFHQILHREPVAPRARNAAVSRELEAVILCAMDKEPARRYASAAAFADDLDALLEMRPVHARPSGAFRRAGKWARRKPAAALASVLALLVVLGGPLAYAWFEHDARARISVEHAGTLRERAEVLRLADALIVKRLARDAQELWPQRPQQVAPMERWLAGAAEALQNEVSHRETLARWEAEAAEPARAADDTLRWRVDTSRELLAAMEQLHATVADVTRRLAVSRRIGHDTVEAHAAAWQEAAHAMANDPKFRGLELAPQVGLIPLGPDPDSGLWEFWAPESGDEPPRDDKSGHVVIHTGSALVFVLLPGGTFMMGNVGDASPEALADESEQDSAPHDLPVHEVTLGPFFMSKFELTQGQWERIGARNESWNKAEPGTPTYAIDLCHPAENMTHSTTVEALRHVGLTLPTEAQWEYAARAGTTTPWWTGATVESVAGAANLLDQSAATVFPALGVAEPFEDGYASHAPVGLYRPNQFGLHDTIGNVMEMCRDGPAAYTEPTSGPDGLRASPDAHGDPGREGPAEFAVRGGAFDERADASTASHRIFLGDQREPYLGCRPARAIER